MTAARPLQPSKCPMLDLTEPLDIYLVLKFTGGVVIGSHNGALTHIGGHHLFDNFERQRQ